MIFKRSLNSKSYITGDKADVTTLASGGLFLMGNGIDVDDTIKLMIIKSDGGANVAVRATGGNKLDFHRGNRVSLLHLQLSS